MIPQVDLFSFVFGRNWRHQKDTSKLTDLYKAAKVIDFQRFHDTLSYFYFISYTHIRAAGECGSYLIYAIFWQIS